jgi:hypothetical protein
VIRDLANASGLVRKRGAYGRSDYVRGIPVAGSLRCRCECPTLGRLKPSAIGFSEIFGECYGIRAKRHGFGNVAPV